jgi:hypothetical protein
MCSHAQGKISLVHRWLSRLAAVTVGGTVSARAAWRPPPAETNQDTPNNFLSNHQLDYELAQDMRRGAFGPRSRYVHFGGVTVLFSDCVAPPSVLCEDVFLDAVAKNMAIPSVGIVFPGFRHNNSVLSARSQWSGYCVIMRVQDGTHWAAVYQGTVSIDI